MQEAEGGFVTWYTETVKPVVDSDKTIRSLTEEIKRTEAKLSDLRAARCNRISQIIAEYERGSTWRDL